jgi:hypothetical protein
MQFSYCRALSLKKEKYKKTSERSPKLLLKIRHKVAKTSMISASRRVFLLTSGRRLKTIFRIAESLFFN